MKRNLPPLTGLEAFEAAARQENFLGAARELDVSKSTISDRVRSLEAHLGQQLFERLPRGVRLTEHGRAYLPSVRAAFDSVQASTTGVFGSTTSMPLTIRAPVSYTALWLPGITERFCEEHPHIRLAATSSIWTARLSTTDVDVDFRLGNGEWPDVPTDLVCDAPLIVAAAPQYTGELESRTIDDIAASPLVHVMGNDDSWTRLFATFGIERPPDPRDIRVDSTVAAIGYATTSQRLVLLSRRLAEPLLSTGALVRMLDHELAATDKLYITRPQLGHRDRAEAILFRNWLQQQGDTAAN